MSVTVYTSSSCPWCLRAKRYLDSKKIEYREVNVSRDRMGAFEMVLKSGQRSVPVIDIDGNIIVGFDRKAIDSLLSGNQSS
ncbi:glutaredoxin family protein [Clostridium thermarum]|uniref:glutaredoxin family protein n=1 Tax=Clostridium thermarum TaxID=1716543 RepID=UPI001120521D|nr:glutaredoxin domain-containing protein [Clostridium thermarum]